MQIAATVGALLLGAGIVASGLYQAHSQTPVDPDVAGNGHKARAMNALAQGRYGTAIEDGRAALWERPLDQEALSTVGTAYLATGHGRQSGNFFRVSAQLGWRDPLTQRFWIMQSLQANAFGSASQWLDATLRTSRTNDLVQAALPILESTDQGRAALVARIKQNPTWLDDWIMQAPTLDDIEFDDRLAVLNAIRPLGISPSARAISYADNRLFRQLRYRAALELWQIVATAGSMVDQGLWESDFSHQPSEDVSATPFQWNLVQQGAAQPEIEDDNGRKRLSVTSNSNTAQPVAMQATILPSGPMKATWRATTSGDGTSLLYPRISCAGGPVLKPVADGHDGDTHWVTVVIPSQNCPAQFVTVWYDPNLSGANAASLDFVRFQPVDLR